MDQSPIVLGAIQTQKRKLVFAPQFLEQKITSEQLTVKVRFIVQCVEFFFYSPYYLSIYLDIHIYVSIICYFFLFFSCLPEKQICLGYFQSPYLFPLLSHLCGLLVVLVERGSQQCTRLLPHGNSVKNRVWGQESTSEKMLNIFSLSP